MQPNVVLIHCHDLGDHLGCYPGRLVDTPNLNRLASDGVVFDNYYAAAPTCSPSRGAMLTGLLPHRNGLMALASGGHWEVREDVPTLPEILRDAGYATASFGTWHISLNPLTRGIDVGDEDARWDVASREACDYLASRPDGQPFFLMAGFREPHRPFAEPDSDASSPQDVRVPPYLPDVPETRVEMRRFCDDVRRMDRAAGRVLDALAKHGLDRETLVIFTSDHGIAMPLAKGTLYDPGIKIPLIVRQPGARDGGRRCGAMTSNVDLLPTILEAIGEGHRAPPDLDGTSLWPFIAEGRAVGHSHVFAEQTWHDFYEPIRAIRTERYKVIRNYEAGMGIQIAADILPSATVDVMRDMLRAWPRPDVEVYDLEHDPTERRNLAGDAAYAAVQAEMLAQLDAMMERTADPILSGVVPAPVGYWEHFCAKPNGPGALPPERGREGWLTVRWPMGATKHRCG